MSENLILAAAEAFEHGRSIHRQRDGVLLAETRGMKQAVIDAFKSGAMDA